MSTDIAVYEDDSGPKRQAHLPATIFDMPPSRRIAFATLIADELSRIIEKQKLYAIVQGKKHVLVEGWNVMGVLLGIMPREREVKRLDNGSYEASVDLVNVQTGLVVGGASHICSVNEKRWSNADEYAVRSMAVTRATGKSFRLGFSWVMKLAGYEPTPMEEMPWEEAPQKPAQPPQSFKQYDAKEHGPHLHKILAREKVPEACWGLIEEEMANKTWEPMTIRQTVDRVVRDYRNHEASEVFAQ
jgi:hypothetical protein